MHLWESVGWKECEPIPSPARLKEKRDLRCIALMTPSLPVSKPSTQRPDAVDGSVDEAVRLGSCAVPKAEWLKLDMLDKKQAYLKEKLRNALAT